MNKIVDILKQNNYSDKQIEEILAGVTKSLYARLYSEAMLSFTDGDLKDIEEADEDVLSDTIAYYYKLRTGKNPDTEAQKYLENFATGFIAQYEKDKAAGLPLKKP